MKQTSNWTYVFTHTLFISNKNTKSTVTNTEILYKKHKK